MNIKNIHYNKVEPLLNSCRCVKKKRERSVYCNDQYYYKIWVKNWTQGDITKFAVDNGFYDEVTSPALQSLIYDESGQRGYIMAKGVNLNSQNNHRDWTDIVRQTSKKERYNFFLYLIEKSLLVSGLYLDLASSNIVSYNNKLSLIDLESYGSFNFVFNGKKEWYEKFDLNAWWKPLDTARRDLDLFYKDYLSQCLGINYNKTINSPEDIKNILNELKKLKICSNAF